MLMVMIYDEFADHWLFTIALHKPTFDNRQPVSIINAISVKTL